jgi:PKD repeat protein
MQTSIAVNQAVHVNAVKSSTLNAGTPLTARYAWDFGDPNGKYNKLEGFNAAHAYDTPGTYTIRLTLTNEAGKTSVATKTISVSASTRRKIYISSLGSDSNNGSSSSSPIRTAARAQQLVGNTNNVEILFRRGDQFNLATTLVTHGNNVVFGAYGTGNRPQLNVKGFTGLSIVSMWGRDTVVRDLAFNDPNRLAKGVSPHGINVVVRDCQFLNIADGINCNGHPVGVLAQENVETLVSGLRGFLIWSEGTDHVLLGNSAPNSVEAQVIRSGGTDRLLVAYNDLTNLDRRPADPLDFDRETLTLRVGSYAWVAHNKFSDGRVVFGPLGGADGIMKPDYLTQRQRWTVVEANTFHNTIDVDHGTEHIVLRNNVIDLPDWPLIKVDGYSNTYQRGVVDLNVFNNTAINIGHGDNFLKINGSVAGINVLNNVYVAPNMSTGAYTAAPVYVTGSSLNSFTKITNNVWYVGKIGAYAEGGINYIWPTWSNSDGYQTPTEWNSLSQVGTDVFSKTTLDSRYAPISGSSAIGEGMHAPGVFVDFYGNARPASGAITAGAVQV